jgi:hypothetical protein
VNWKKVTKLIIAFFGLLLIGGVVLPNLVRSKVGCAETPLSDLMVLDAALTTYSSAYNGYPPTLAALGPPPKGVAPNANAAGLIRGQLAAGSRLGYRFIYHALNSDGKGGFDKYTITADPIPGGVWAKGPHMFVDETAQLHLEENSTATAMSPNIDFTKLPAGW